MGNILLLIILIWKNFKLQIRHPWITLLQLLIPALFMIILILLRRLSSIEKREVETIFDSYPIDTLPVELRNTSDEIYLYYTPQSPFLAEVMDAITSLLNVSVRGFDDENDLEAFYRNSSHKVIAGIVFDPELSSGIVESGPISFTIRPEDIPGINWNLSYTMPSFSVFELKDKSMYGSYYMDYGFLTVQHAVAKTLLEKLFHNWEGTFDEAFHLEMSRMPYPPYEADSFYKIPDYFIALAICLGFLYPIASIAKNLVHERRTNLKKTLQMMGVSNWENWLAWFIKDFIFFFIICLIMTFLLCKSFGGPAVLNKSTTAFVLLWLTLYACSLIAFTYFISIFFNKGNSAVAGVCILYIITFLPYMHSRGLFSQVPYAAKLVLCIFPNTAFSYSVHVILNLELLGHGLDQHSQHFFNAINVEFSMHIANTMLGFDILIYFILTWYAEVVRLGSFPNRQPWYFPLTASYWTGMTHIPTDYPKPRHTFNEYFERDPPKVRPMIHIKNLTKAYGKRLKPVVESVDLNAYKGQITILLGHNCCGKSTFTSMIYGGMPPTAGSIIIRGYNIFKAEQKRNLFPFLGICPEYDISIDELTIKENLYFFCKIKGFDAAAIKSEVHHILGLFDLDIKKHKLVSTLSKSAKRLLSVGIALVGDSEVVILDEPTLGMNSNSRRITWDALILEKESRAIFLTTSHIKEAFSLANRIAVLHEGHLRCVGSPMFLKKKYGMGFLLTLTKDTEYNSVRVRTVIRKRIPDAQIISETEAEHKILLPPDNCDLYQSLLEDLEGTDLHTDLHIKNIFINELSLGELFNKIVDSPVSSDSSGAREYQIKFIEEEAMYYSFPKERNDGFALFSQHVNAVFRKKYIFSKRSIILTLSQIIILPLILALSNLMREAEVFENVSVGKNSIFDLESFGKTTVMYGIDPRTNLTINLGDTYATLLDKTGENSILVDLEDKNYLSELIQTAQDDLKAYRLQYIIGAAFEVDTINETLITAFYNSEAYHAAPISLLYVHNALLRHFSKEESLSFQITHKPLPLKDEAHQSLSKNFKLTSSFYWAQDLLIGLAFLMSSFVVLLVIEISTRSKKQQFISGLNAFTYWFSVLLYDYALYLIPSFFAILIILIFETECLYDDKEIGTLALLLLLHGLSSLLFIYCWTLCCRSAPTAYIGIFLYYLLGLLLVGVVYRLEIANHYDISEPLNIAFTILMPSYCIGRGIYNVHRNCMTNDFCNNDMIQAKCANGNDITSFVVHSCCLDRCSPSCLYWSPNHLTLSISGILKQVIALAIQPVVYILIIILIEMELVQILKEKRLKYYETKSETDKDVLKEEKRILSLPVARLVDENYSLILRGVSKLRPRLVIGKLSFAVKKGECFGLMGIDLSGKSTVLAMISGSTPLSTGDIYIDGMSMMNSPHKVLDKIGFSFGRETLLNKLTVSETLMLYGQIRGIPDKKIHFFIKCLTETLKLYPHFLVKKCNKTDQRKLCLAISVIGMPPLILLEEPTIGLDPTACRNVHKVIKQARMEKCTVFLTTQKMNECQALCNRIGILVSGKLQYIGDLNNLRENYKDGFTLILSIMKGRSTGARHTRQAITGKGGMDEVKGHIEITYPQAELKIEFNTYLNYYFPDRDIKWSKLFNILETMKSKGLIMDYSISETVLDQMFLYNVHTAKDHYKEKKITDFLKERKLANM